MPRLTPDPTFYPTPRDAMGAPPEKLAYLALSDPAGERPDGIGVVDVDPGSPGYGTLVGRTDMPSPGDGLRHLGWNACSSHLGAHGAQPHLERRYLVAPGVHSSRIAIVDTRPDPRRPEIVKVIEGSTLAERTGYTHPHTTRPGPGGIFVNALGGVDGNGPGGIFTLHPETFEVQEAWETDRGDQYLAGDFRWHPGHDTMVTSEWGTPNMLSRGLDPELFRAGKYGNALHVWDRKAGKRLRRLELGPRSQMALALRPAHDPARPYGFAGVAVSREDLSAAVWLWHLDGQGGSAEWKARKVIDIPAQPADDADLPDVLKGFGAVPPLVTDLALALDDRDLYVSCWGTGELIRYDVTDPFAPVRVASLRLGGIVERAPHPSHPHQPLSGAPQMVELSRDGTRAYLTSSFYSSWDAQLHSDGDRGWMVKVDLEAEGGGMTLDPGFFVEMEDGMRPGQVRLQDGDASSDSFCSRPGSGS